MQLPRIRAMRQNAAIHDFVSLRMDASIGLNKFGLFSLTLGALTSGSSKDGNLELLDLARKVGINEEDKESWENFRLGVCGLSSGDFRTCFDEVKQKLRGAGFLLETIQMVFSHAIIGLPKNEKLLMPIQERLKDALFDVAVKVDNGTGLESRTYEFILFEYEFRVWDVYSAFSVELQRERGRKPKCPRCRTHLKQKLIEQAIDQDDGDEPDKEVP